jgi:hypothetical protein
LPQLKAKPLAHIMKKPIIILFSVLCHLSSIAQLNIDSLRSCVENSDQWIKTEIVKYEIFTPFQRFMKIDSTETYDLHYDSSGKLSEYIGVAVINKKYDYQGRLIKIIGYSIVGSYYLWDFSPIEIHKYYGDTTEITHYSNRYEISRRFVTIKDSIDRIIEHLWLDENLQLIVRTSYSFNDSLNEVYITTYNSLNEIQLNKQGVGVKWQKFNPSKREEVIEERYYDDKMILVDANHELYKTTDYDCRYAIVKRKYLENDVRSSYYSSKGELECETTNWLVIKKTIKIKRIEE